MTVTLPSSNVLGHMHRYPWSLERRRLNMPESMCTCVCVCVGGVNNILGTFQSHLLMLEYFLFKTASPVVQADLELAMQPKLTGNI